MQWETLEAISSGALKSVHEAEVTPLRYVMRAVIGGMLLFIGVFLSIMTSALIQDLNPGLGKVLGAFVFPIGLILILMFGAQLYTSTCLYQPMGVLTGKVKISQGLKVMVLCFIGNILGLAILCELLAGGGEQREILTVYLHHLVEGRLAVAPMQTFLRAILCNFYICVSSFVGYKMTSETGKITVIFFVIAGFVLSGTDHSIANGAYFMLYKMLEPATGGGLTMLRNVALATAGNFLGGAVLVALPTWYIGNEKK